MKKTNARERSIVKVSATGIAVNIVLAAVKAGLGILTGSVAVISDAINNITDSSSALITIIGTKLAQKRPDKSHPFGYGRIEYLTSLIIGVIVLVTGIEMAISSVKNIIRPPEVSYNITAITILSLTIFAKLILGIYTQKAGKKLDSGALTASGADAKNDALISAVTVACAVIWIVFKISIDAYASTLISACIIKTGLEVLKETLSQILGQRADAELSHNIYSLVSACPGVLGVHDLILNNYGPENYVGSVNVEVDHKMTAGEMYPELYKMREKVWDTYHVLLVFGLYAVSSDSAISQNVESILQTFMKEEKHCISYHGIVIDDTSKKIYLDIVLDFECDTKELEDKAHSMVSEKYPDYTIIVTVDTEFA